MQLIQSESARSEEITFEVEKDLSSFQIAVEVFEGEGVFVESLVSPDGIEIIRSNWGSPSQYRVPPRLYTTLRSKLRPTFVIDDIFSLIIKHDEISLAGSWKMRFASSNKKGFELVYDMRKLSISSKLKVPRLIMNLHLNLNNSKLDKSEVEKAISSIEELYQRHGIDLSIQTDWQWEDTLSQVNDLEVKLAELSLGKKEGVHLYLFPQFNPSFDKDFQGLAGCLPGFVAQNVQKNCALVVSYQNKRELNLRKMIKVISHELAHYLGLFHLEDDFYPYGRVTDLIEDTTSDVEENNIMHKTSDVFDDLQFTRGQVEKMLSHPILYQ